MDSEAFFSSRIQDFAQNSTEAYPRMAEIMQKFGYDWEAYQVNTEDHYILTTFHILGLTGKERPTKHRGTVLIQHGNFQDGAFWLKQLGDSTPFHLLLAEEGYDVWIGNNRGTEYSQDHETLCSKDDKEYWNWTWADMGLYDNVANIRAIKQLTGVHKVYYIGYSQGAIQMLYGLAHLESDFFADSLIKVVQLAPCFVPQTYSDEVLNNYLLKYRELGVYAINGPNWERDRQILCEKFPAEVCDYYKTLDGYMGQGVESEIYWLMNGNSSVRRFQEKQDNEKWIAGELETPLVPLENIKQVPIAMFIATDDATCPYDSAKEYIPKIGSQITQILVEGAGHAYFYSQANTQWFMDNLIAQLQDPTTSANIQSFTQ